MTDPAVDAVVTILRRQRIQFVVVGGQAIARDAATATRDADVMVATSEYASTVARLRTEEDLTFDWDSSPIARFRIRSVGGVPLDVIDAAAFSGDQPPGEFFRYLAREGSLEVDGVAFATPEAVWYTRLMTKRWKSYAEKIVTNVIDGLSPDRLAAVEEVAKRFGNQATIRVRLAYVREELARPDIASLVRRP